MAGLAVAPVNNPTLNAVSGQPVGNATQGGSVAAPQQLNGLTLNSGAGTVAEGSNTTNTGGNTSNTSTTTGGLNNPNLPEYLQGIQQEYGATINAAPTTQNLYGQQEGLGIANAQGSAAAQTQQQNAQAGVLGTEANTTQAQQQLSLAQLAQMIRGQYAGLNAQLGSVGAGSSSAVGMGAQGLAQEQNTQRASIQQQAAGNLAQIQSQQQGVQANIAAINQWQQNQVATIQNNYGQLMNQLSQAVQQAQGEEKARLAEYGQTLTDSANAALTQVENTTPGQIATSLTQGAQAEGQLQPAGTPVSAINVPSISPFSTGANLNSGNATAVPSAPTGGSLGAILQNQANQPLA